MFGFGKEKEKPREKFEIRILPVMEEAAGELGQDLSEWLDDQISLAYAVDAGRVYQLQSGIYQKLSINDVRPYSESWGNLADGDFYDVISIYKDNFDDVKNPGKDDAKTWSLRVINLGIMAPNMGLHFLNDEGEYLPIYTSVDGDSAQQEL